MENRLDNLEKTKLELDLENFEQKIKDYSEEKLKKNLLDINKKLFVKYNLHNRIIELDISSNAEQKNRLYLRKKMSKTTKWVNYMLNKRLIDFSDGWNYINAVFVSKDANPNYASDKMPYLSNSFLATLSLKGLSEYNKYLTLIVDEAVFKNQPFKKSVNFAKITLLDMGNVHNNSYYDNLKLTDGWKTAYKNVMKQKILLNELIKREEELITEK